jgi:hypothetical protein
MSLSDRESVAKEMRAAYREFDETLSEVANRLRREYKRPVLKSPDKPTCANVHLHRIVNWGRAVGYLEFLTENSIKSMISGGGGEIRTHERLPVAGFQDQCLKPLGHASNAQGGL